MAFNNRDELSEIRAKMNRAIDRVVDVRDFGVPVDGITDCAGAMIEAFGGAAGHRVYIPPGVYRWGSGAKTLTMSENLAIDACGVTWLNDHSASTTITFKAEEVATPTITADISRGDLSFSVASAAGLQVGQLIHFSSSAAYEASYSYKKHEVHTVAAVAGATVTVCEPFVFDYDVSAETVTTSVRKNVALTINGELSLTYPSGGGATGRVLDLNGLKGSRISGIRSIDPQVRKASGPDPVFLHACHSTLLENVYCSGIRYGINVSNGSRDTTITDMRSERCWHPFDFNTAAYGCRVRYVTGYDNVATLQCHPCFLFNVENLMSQGDEGIACRSVGVNLRNIDIRTDKAWGANSINASVFLSVDIHDEYDFIVDNMRLETPNATVQQRFGTGSSYRRALYRAVDFAEIDHGLNTSTQIFVDQSNVAAIRSRGGETLVSDTTVDASHREAVGVQQYAFKLDNALSLKVSGCTIKGGHQYLLRDPVPGSFLISFVGSEIYGITTGLQSGITFDNFDLLFSSCKGGSNTWAIASYTGTKIKCDDACVGLDDLQHRKKGVATATTNASGTISIAHGIYATPTWAQVKILGDVTMEAMVQAISETTITVRIANLASNGVDVPSTSVTVLWEAEI